MFQFNLKIETAVSIILAVISSSRIDQNEDIKRKLQAPN